MTSRKVARPLGDALRRAGTALACALLLAPVGAAHAKPRVPPVPADYGEEDLGWIRFRYQRDTHRRVRELTVVADELRAALSERLGRPVLASVEVRVAALAGELVHFAPPELAESGWGGTMHEERIIVLVGGTAGSPYPRDHVERFRYALADLALYDALGGRRAPAWLADGFAAHFADPFGLARGAALAAAALERRLLGVDEIDRLHAASAPRDPAIAAQTADLARHVVARGDDGLARVVARLREGASVRDALAALDPAGGLPGFERAARHDIARRYAFTPILAGGTALLGLGALASALARRRGLRESDAPASRRPAVSAPGAERPRTSPRLAPGPVEPSIDPPPPEAEIPRVRHGGEWHTLH